MIPSEIKTKFNIALLFCAIYSIPLFLFGGYYIDDLIRSIQGNTDWIFNGRLLSEFFMKSLYFGNKMIDISPLPQIIAIVIAAFTISALANKYCKENSLLGILVFLPLWISPFYLQNISYKYDSGLMALSILTASFIFMLRIDSLIKLLSFGFIAVFCTLNLYQPSINVFAILILMEFINLVKNKKYDDAIKRTLIIVVAFLLANIAYTLTISKVFVKGDYSISHSETISLIDFLPTIHSNISSFYSLIKMSLPRSFFIVLIPAALVSLFYLVRVILIKKETLLIKKILINTALILTPFFILIFVVGPMLLLKNPTLAPRTLVGFSAFLSAIFLPVYWLSKKSRVLALLILIVPTLYMFEISYAYYNALRNQNKYEDMIITNMSYDLGSINSSKHKDILINGRVELAPENKIAAEVFPIIDFLVPRNINGSEFWGIIQLKHYDIFLKNDNNTIINDSEVCKLPMLKEGVYYNLHASDNSILFDFKKIVCKIN